MLYQIWLNLENLGKWHICSRVKNESLHKDGHTDRQADRERTTCDQKKLTRTFGSGELKTVSLAKPEIKQNRYQRILLER